MKKQIFTLLLLIFIVLTAQSQWTYLRSLSYGSYPSTFDGVGYASMKFGLCGKQLDPHKVKREQSQFTKLMNPQVT